MKIFSALKVENILWMEKGNGIRASGKIPAQAEFFKDHFPDFPILPGVLAVGILKKSAESYFYQTGFLPLNFRCRLKKLEQTRFSHYLKPGDPWESRLRILSQRDGEFEWEARLFREGRSVVSVKMVTEIGQVSQPVLV